jgi:hypothetical protein
MRLSRLIPGVVSATFLPLMAQEPSAPASGPDALRNSVREWIETMREIQKEEDSWEKDREVLQGYKEGLQKEIEDLKEQIERAKTERDSAGKEDLDKVAKAEAYAKAKEALVTELKELEKSMVERLPLLPAAMTAEPKVAQMIEEVKKDGALTGDAAKQGLAKRLNNVLNLLSEVEKFQQAVHLRDELHKAPDGREFNMKVLYFGIAAAYAVNETGDFALVGKPSENGWSFSERNDLAPRIKELVGVTTGDIDAKFVTLPIDLP